ncbi:response regulator [Halomonas campisalis]|uniref:Response regulator n=1 Tax=Billgrantia campisalis TaxID=74661 RepID=A0ABS9PC15_9GAMM|nr:HD domain-containing phosphohydrolase [Halomonas campisalis]MCG6659318.1 response regulator [Halomonas campisalis]MDR5863920.1 response regulator [Halomonas campisalis]
MQEHDAPQERPTATLLLVDDEPHVLSALKRALRREHYRLLTAADGEQALALLDTESVDLVVSDSLMPGMDGAELLGHIQRRWPDCLRMLLTGRADLKATVRAINEGHIYHFIAKPWDDDELRLTIRQALAHQQAKREQQRLEALTQAQNRELVELNANLEARVAARTQELQQVADMLDAAYGDLKHSYVTATQVFSSLLNQRLPRHLQTNAQVGDLIKAFAETHGLEEELQRELMMAAALYNLGKLTWDDHLLSTPAQRLFAREQTAYRHYPETGEGLLMTLEPLQGAARLIRHHRERWNGSGYPDHLQGEAIPYGARLLALAVDFIELQRGMILPRKVPRQDALDLLRKFSGRVYDPALCKSFVALCIEQAPDLGLAGKKVLSLPPRKLEPDMTLAQDLHSPSGMLLLNQGKALTRQLIDKLIRLEELEDTQLSLLVHPPEAANAEPHLAQSERNP